MEWLPQKPNNDNYIHDWQTQYSPTRAKGANVMETEFSSEKHINPQANTEGTIHDKKKQQYSFFEFSDVFEPINNTVKKDNPKEPPSEDTWLLQTNEALHYTNNGNIPKLINKMYFQTDSQFQDIEQIAAFENLKEAHNSWQLMNHGYTVRYFNLQSSREYLRRFFHPVFLRTFDCIEAFAGKSDFFRMALLYREGGWHSDWKQVCLQPNLLDRISEETDVFITMDTALRNTRHNGCMQTAFVGSIPKHPILSTYLKIVMQHVHESYYEGFNLFATGPCALGLAVKQEAKQHRDKAARYNQTASLGKYYCDSKKFACHFYWKEEQVVLHKCEGCGISQDWEMGNNYNTLFQARNFYCEDSAAIFAA